MRIHCTRGSALAGAAAALLLTAGPAGAQQVIDVELPYPIPVFSGGEDLPGFGEVWGDLATILPKYFYRPMDDLSARAGADAMALGGAFVSRPEGAMSMAWNPAGLGTLRGRSVVFDGYMSSSTGSMGQDELPDTIFVPQSPNFQILSYTDKLGSANKFGFAGIAGPVLQLGGKPLVGGVCFRRHTEVAAGTETILEMGLVEGTGFPFILGSDNKERGAIYSYTFSAGYQPIEKPGLSLSVGGTFNLLDGRLRAQEHDRVNVRGYPEGFIDYQVDYAGKSLEVGALLRVRDLVQAGAWASMPYTLHVTNSHFTAQNLVSPDAGIIVRTHGRIADYDLEIPMFLSGGVSVGPLDAGPVRALRVSADVNYRPWSDTDLVYTGDSALRFGPLTIPLSEFNGSYPMKDVTSIHAGGEFEFPFFRGAIQRAGMQLTTCLGFRTVPLSMAEVDLVDGQAPYYLGDQVKGNAIGFGLSLDTGIGVLFHGGMELQSYSFRKWFMDDTSPSDAEHRTLSFTDPYARAGTVDRTTTLFRFTTELRK